MQTRSPLLNGKGVCPVSNGRLALNPLEFSAHGGRASGQYEGVLAEDRLDLLVLTGRFLRVSPSLAVAVSWDLEAGAEEEAA